MARVAIVLAVALCLSSLGAVKAQKPDFTAGNGVFNSSAADYKFSHVIPTNQNKLSANIAPALGASGFNSRGFFLAPCSLFVPHFHPKGAELFLGVRGQVNLVAMIGTSLVRNKIFRDDAVQVPPNTLHYFYNNMCEEGAVITSLNSAAPGFRGYYSIPNSIRNLKANYAVVKQMADTVQSNGTLDATRVFFTMTNDCKAKCAKRG